MSPTVNGIATETGYRGYDAWWWGVADAVLEALVTFSVRNVVRLTDRLAHFTSERHTPEECDKGWCEWWVEDVDKGIDKLNDVTSEGYVWYLQEGGLYLSSESELEEWQ